MRGRFDTFLKGFFSRIMATYEGWPLMGVAVFSGTSACNSKKIYYIYIYILYIYIYIYIYTYNTVRCVHVCHVCACMCVCMCVCVYIPKLNVPS